MSAHTRACERCGTGERVSTSKRTHEREHKWARAGEGMGVKRWGVCDTGLTNRGVRWGLVCDECWAKVRAEADATCEWRAKFAEHRMGILRELVERENAIREQFERWEALGVW